MILTVAEARSLVERCMVRLDHTGEEAAIIADHLIDCELRGLTFGGLPRALSVIERIRRTEPKRRLPRLLHETPVSASIDGGDTVGYIVGRRATEIAIAKARQIGMAAVGVTDTWYTGMFSYYMEMATREGLVAMAAGSSAPYVAPYGGTEGQFGTNPISFGFPSAEQDVILDIGTSAVMVGEAVLAGRRGEQLAPGLAFDQSGEPTTDPVAALAGAFAVWGGHKGSGVALMVQLLGMMAGAPAKPPRTAAGGFLVMVIDPGLFGPGPEFPRKVADYANEMRATRPVDPARPVRMPFDRSAAERARRLAEDRIDVSEAVYQALCAAAGQPGAR